MQTRQRTRSKAAAAAPTKARPARPRPRRFNVLSSYQSVLDFANTKITKSNFLDLLGGGVMDEAIILENLTLAGKAGREITEGAASQLQGCIRDALGAFLAENNGPLGIPPPAAFKMRGREPRGPIRDAWWAKPGEPGVTIQEDLDGIHFRSNDLQDFWYETVLNFIRAHRRYEGIPPNKRLAGWTDRLPPAGMSGPGPGAFPVAFHPLARCAAAKCSRFFFRKRPRDRTCGARPCARQLDHQTHKSRRRPPQEPRHKVSIPAPRAKRRPA